MFNNIIQSSIKIPDDVVSKIYDIKNNSPYIPLRTNVKGWQSIHYKLGDLEWLTPFLNECLTKLELTHLSVEHYWFNINPTGAHHNWHNHIGNEQVAVCYIQVPKDSGNIEFRHSKNTYEIEPISGMIIKFPSTIDHRVLPNKASTDRITLAFNLQVKR